MSISVLTLKLKCKTSIETIDFSHVTFFHGEMATGKSTIARLITFCLGGDLEQTPALQHELVSVALSLVINNYRVLIEREAVGSKQVLVDWSSDNDVSERRLVPIIKTDTPIFSDDIYSLSDLLLYFLKIPNLKVPNSREFKTIPIGLSFQDLMTFCYLEQDIIDSSFFALDKDADTFKKRKSKVAMRFIIGLFTERISELELAISTVENEKKKRAQQIENIRAFLAQFGYNSEKQVNDEIITIKRDIDDAKVQLAELKTVYRRDTGFVDELRKEIVDAEKKTAIEEKAIRDINRKISEQEQLRMELIGSKYKLSRFMSAKEIMDGAHFEYCPLCGLEVETKLVDGPICVLCGQKQQPTEEQMHVNKLAKLDIESRIKELEESIFRFRNSLEGQTKELGQLIVLRTEKDSKLSEILTSYDSQFLAQSLELERKIASAQERIQNLDKLSEMPKAVDRLEKELLALGLDIENLERQLLEEESKKKKSEYIIKELEDNYKKALLSISLPDFYENDTVVINRSSWIPEVIPADKTKKKWSFENIGSNGVKTLLNVCFALVLHKVSKENSCRFPLY
jgi:AAA domain